MSTTADRIIATLAEYGIDDPETLEYVRSFTFLTGHSYSVDTDRGDVEIGIDEGGPTTLEAMIEADRQMIADEDSDLEPDAEIEIDRAAMTTNISGLPGFRILAD